MAVTTAIVLARIREGLAESAAAYWVDSVDSAVFRWYDEWAAEQHRIVFEIASQRGLLPSIGHDYLRYFLKSATAANFVAGTQDYNLPSDYWRYMAKLRLTTGGVERIAEEVNAEDDHLIRSSPVHGPTFERPLYAIVPSTSATGKIRFYVVGDRTVPNSTDEYQAHYYRDVIATASPSAGNVDLPDPYNTGPVLYAQARAWQKERDRQQAEAAYAAAVSATMSIIDPLPAQKQQLDRRLVAREWVAQARAAKAKVVA